MIVQAQGRRWEVHLLDDGTLDTVISVQPVAQRYDRDGNLVNPAQEFRFSDTHDYRRGDGSLTQAGFRLLALEAIDEYEMETNL
jgi:hypothetical protein